MADNDSGIDVSERSDAPDQAKRPPKTPIYPELSPRYFAILKWLALVFVAFVLWLAFHSGYA